MFLCGDQIINDYNFDILFRLLCLSGAIRGVDYFYFGEKKIILRPTSVILNIPHIYQHEILSVTTTHKIIGRTIDHKKRKITDRVFDASHKFGLKGDKWGPITIGWTYNFNTTSLVNWIMQMVDKIPINHRKDPLYVATYFCSKIDSCNDSMGLIEGKWSETFSDGKHPSSWRGAGEIFQERISTGRPAKYGQCWILADLLVGILKFLGIPSRSIRVNRCIIDLYDIKGMDMILEEGMTFKSLKNSDSMIKKIINPKNMLKDESFNHHIDIKSLNLEKTITKGPLFSLDKDFKVEERDFYDLNGYSQRDGVNWNFHVWTEFCHNKDWYVLDPTPLHGVGPTFLPYLENQRWPEFNGLRFFGPVKVESIRLNKPDPFLPATSRYLFSCINGQVRYWTPLIQKKRRVLYLSNVEYKFPYVVGKEKSGKTIDATDLYREKNEFYHNFHREHPVFIKSKGNDLTKVHLFFPVEESIKSKYVLQFSLLSGNQILYLHRESAICISKNMFSFLKETVLQKYRKIADRLTITIYNLVSGKFWSQCIKI